jgi:hypothetical protein
VAGAVTDADADADAGADADVAGEEAAAEGSGGTGAAAVRSRSGAAATEDGGPGAAQDDVIAKTVSQRRMSFDDHTRATLADLGRLAHLAREAHHGGGLDGKCLERRDDRGPSRASAS